MLSTEIIEKSELAELYTKLTGLTYDIDTVIANTPDEEKAELFRNINWHIQKGLVYTEDGTIKTLAKELVPEIMEKLNISEDFDLDNDGTIDESEQAIKDSYVELDLGSEDEEDDE